MENYQKRLIKEFKELSVKLQKLENWLSKEKNLYSVSPEMRDAMLDQQAAMQSYQCALFRRLELMGLANEVAERLPYLEMGEIIETNKGKKFRCVGYTKNGEPIMEEVY